MKKDFFYGSLFIGPLVRLVDSERIKNTPMILKFEKTITVIITDIWLNSFRTPNFKSEYAHYTLRFITKLYYKPD